MVLAAGLGTRLWPLTADRAKPAVPFLGKPLIAGILELLERSGFDAAVVNTHHLPGSITAAIAQARLHHLEVELSHEPEILGTAGALAKARAAGLLSLEEPTLIINAKLYTDLDLGAVVEAHRRSGATVTMALRSNAEREQFREVLVSDGRVTGFGPRPPRARPGEAPAVAEPRRAETPAGPLPLLFTGVHVVEAALVRELPVQNLDTVADVYPPLIAAGRVAAHVDDRGRWWELSTLERYLALHHRAFEQGIGPESSLSPGASIAPGATVERAVLWEDARVEAGATARDVVLGRGAIVPAGATLERAVLVRREHAGEPERGTPWLGGQLRVPLAVPPSPEHP